MSGQWRNPDTARFEDRGDVVIPYKSVIEFYLKETQYLKDSEEEREKLALRQARTRKRTAPAGFTQAP
jgi:hypothetical protein